MTIFGSRVGQQWARVFNTPESRCDGQVNAGTSAEQSAHCFEFAVRAWHSTVGICSVIAEQIDQRYLDSGFARYAPRANQAERLIQHRPIILCARIQNQLGDFHDIRGQFPAPNRIFRDKFQQRRILKVIAAFKDNALMDQVRMRTQVSSEPFHISRIQEIHGTAKSRVVNSLLEWKAQVVYWRRLLHSTLQFRPACKSPFAGKRELRVSKAKLRIKDCRI